MSDIKLKRCSLCKLYKDLDDFNSNPHTKDKKSSYCKICSAAFSRKYYSENREILLAKKKEYTQNNLIIIVEKHKKYACKNKEKVHRWDKKNGLKLKNKFFEMYGDRCICCGETHIEFLTIDHIKGQVGVKKKEQGEIAWRRAIKEYRPDLYRVLCMNCNMATRFGRICPHQKEKE